MDTIAKIEPNNLASHSESGVFEEQLSYWQQQLEGACLALELPTDYSRSGVSTCRSARRELLLPQSLAEKLQALSYREGVTLFVTLLASLKALLCRYTAQTDIVVGNPLTGCHCRRNEETTQPPNNTLLLRTDLSGNPTFRELLGRVHQMTLEAYAHQDLPFERVVEALQFEQNLSNRLPQVSFHLQNGSTPSVKLSDLTVDSLFDSEMVGCDLAIELWEGTEGIGGCCRYNADLFAASTVTRMLRHFRTLLESIAIAPEQHLLSLPLLTESEQHQVLVEWNNTQTNYPEDKCVHQLFEAQVEQTPSAVAVFFEGQQLTYRELNQRANQLAHHLQRLGVGPDVLVGISVDRSLEMAIAILGTLKAGGAYVPLDPAYPQERLAKMLENTRSPVLLTQAHLVEGLPDYQTHIICLDREWETIAVESQENPVGQVMPDHLAYVIHTSGSTGQPKGVAMNHRPLVNLLHWQLEHFAHEVTRTLQFAPISFDVSFQESFSTWCSGGTLVLIADAVRRDAVSLLQLLRDEAIERLFLPFVALQHLAEIAEDEKTLPTSLREIITAGEQLQITRGIANWFSHAPNCTLHNQYGPSESHVVTAFTLMGPPKDWSLLPPIGRPIANTQIYLLDSQLQPVPVGISGELYIGGVSLARGYLNRPDLTQERFVPNPFSKKPGQRLYKTGDLARYLPDGNIDYLGRIDNQVKIRGFRIELGEIEAALSKHPAVRDAVVVAREDVPGNKRLVAYLVVIDSLAPIHTELRQFLEEHLPEYMVPATFVFLDALPLTPSGKIDRRALPAPDRKRPELERAFVAPRDELETQISKIWEEYLGIQPIGVQDNFFELGVNSLQAARVFAQIHKLLGKQLPVDTLLQAPTVEQLTVLFRQEKSTRSSLVAIQPNGSKPPFFCLHAGHGNVLFYRYLAHYLGLDRPLYGLQPRGLNDRKPPHVRVEDMAAHYISEIRAIQPSGPYFLGGYCFGATVAFEMAQQLLRQGQEVAIVASFNGVSPSYTARRAEDLDDEPLPNMTAVLPSSPNTRNRIVFVFEELRQGFKQNIRSKMLWLAYKFHLTLNRPFPGKFGNTYQSAIIPWIAKAYTPQIYSGRIVVFRSPALYHDPELGWGRWVTGGIETCDVPGIQGHRLEILREPGVQFVAEKLQDYLHGAQIHLYDNNNSQLSPNSLLQKPPQKLNI